MSRWQEGRVIGNRHWTDALFSLRVEAPALRFSAGQFVRIALDVDGKRVARPFSFVNPPNDPVLEFYGIVVPQGHLSPCLARLGTGNTLYIATNPSGFLVLEEVPQSDELWLIATGTGLAPFLSILRTETPWERYRNVVLVHAVRFARELVYRELIEGVQHEHPGRLLYLRFVSRERAAGALEGRVPAALRDGRLEAAAGPISPERSQFMLCGNPGMVKDMTAALAERGLRKHRRRAPGHVSAESFW